LAAAPVAASHRLVAEEYVRLGILDAACNHYRRAVRLDPKDAAAYEGLARIWRDSGQLGLGLGNAHRAVHFAPASPEAHNTLGTVLLRLGQPKAARAAYERAIALQPEAAYAFNNLCYLSILEGRAAQAIDDCQRAIALDGTLTAARRNLALGYAAAGRLRLSRAELFRVDSPAAAHYNLGIISLARRDYPAAAAAFETACEIRPWPDAACARAQQLRTETRGARGGLSYDPDH
jgi:Flp pilus assembly protein TadD